MQRDLADARKIIVKAPSPGYDNKEYYRKSVDSRKPEIIEPYPFEVERGGVKVTVLETTITVPILDAGGRALGMVGGDIILENFSEKLAAIKPLGSGYTFMVSAGGDFVAHPVKDLVGKNLSQSDLKTLGTAVQLAAVVRKWHRDPVSGTLSYIATAPITYEKAQTSWALGAAFPADMMLKDSSTLRNNIIIFGLVALIILLGVVYYIARGVIGPLTGISGSLDEITTEVMNSAREISESNQKVAEGASQQAASLEESSATLEEMSSMTRRNADNAAQTEAITRETSQDVDRCSGFVVKMSSAMADISDKSENVSRIIKTIEGIAFQTNLLALNAAVEAARAGDAGQGFAVVADEVRNLAQRSAQAARDTTDLIEGTVASVQNGNVIVSDLTGSFTGIEQGTRETCRLINEINVATQEQANGIAQINIAVAEMDTVTQRNAESAHKSALAASNLNTQFQSLESTVRDLVVLVFGRSGLY